MTWPKIGFNITFYVQPYFKTIYLCKKSWHKIVSIQLVFYFLSFFIINIYKYMYGY
jgi:hypothetical protein